MDTFDKEAKMIVSHVLENEPTSATGVCAQCEIEHYGHTRPGSHTWCKRHFIEWFKQNGMSDAQVQEVLSTNPVFAPDMGKPANPLGQQSQNASVMRDLRTA